MTDPDGVDVGPFALDTNAYAEIAAGTPAGGRLRRLLSAERTRLVVLLPVASELAQRSPDPRYQRDVRDLVVGAVPAQRRAAPTVTDWLRVGELVAVLSAAGHDPAGLRTRTSDLDLLIATMCRARGVVLVTADRDHDRTRPHVGHATRPC